jgi:hypothetical protein
MFKNLVQLKSRMTQPQALLLGKNALPRRVFSYRQSPPPSSGFGLGAMFGVGIGTAGLMYLVYHSRQLNAQRL